MKKFVPAQNYLMGGNDPKLYRWYIRHHLVGVGGNLQCSLIIIFSLLSRLIFHYL